MCSRFAASELGPTGEIINASPMFRIQHLQRQERGIWDVKCRQHGMGKTDGQMDRQMCAWAIVQGPKTVSNPFSLGLPH